jgi:carbonic anhydrase
LHPDVNVTLSRDIIASAGEDRHRPFFLRAHRMPAHHTTLSADEALRRLVEGNERFLNGTTRWDRVTVAALTTLVDGQQPYATILGCSDSRVPPELVFDTGLGELFVVRVAGNVFSGEVAGTLQYAGVHLGTPLILVLGHSDCGAVKAALEARRAGTAHQSGIRLLIESVLPALEDVDPLLPLDAQTVMAVEHNVRWTLRQIAATEQGRERLRDGRLKLVGGIYEISSGRVHWMTEVA